MLGALIVPNKPIQNAPASLEGMLPSRPESPMVAVEMGQESNHESLCHLQSLLTKSVQKPTRSKPESSKEKPKTPVPVMMYTTSETSMHDDVDDGLGDDLSADILRNLIEY